MNKQISDLLPEVKRKSKRKAHSAGNKPWKRPRYADDRQQSYRPYQQSYHTGTSRPLYRPTATATFPRFPKSSASRSSAVSGTFRGKSKQLLTHEKSGDTCRGLSEIFHSKMGKDNSRSMGVISDSRRVQIRIHDNSFFQWHKRDQNTKGKYVYSVTRGRYFITKASYRKSRPHFESRFLKHICPGPKENRRRVINLRPLIMYLRTQHFKMDSMKTVLSLVQKGDYAFSLYLADAFLHLPIFPKHRTFLRFCVNQQVYQFRVMAFGPKVAPTTFTKCVTVVAAFLRQQSLKLSLYLDDRLGLNATKRGLLQYR